MIRSPRVDGAADPGLGPVGGADGVEHVEGPAGRTAVERPRQRADGPDDGRGQVGPGRRDDPGGEGRGVEAVVDGQDQVLLDGPHMGGRGLFARQHPQVVGGVGEVVRGGDRVRFPLRCGGRR